MNIFQIRLFIFLAIGLLLSMPAVAMNPGAKPAGERAYSCDLSPAEFMTAAVSQTMEDDPDAEISFEFHATVVKDNKMLVKSMDGLPGGKPQDDGSLTTTIMVPILVSEFRENDIFESDAFQSHVSEMLSRLQARKSTDEFSCGDSPSDTVIVENIDSCLLGNLKTEFTGRVHPVTGDEEWFVKSSKFGFSDRAECKSHIQIV